MLNSPATPALSQASGLSGWWRRLAWEKRDTLFVLLTLSLVISPHFTHLPAWCIGLITVLFVTRLYLTLAGRALPGKFVLLALLLLAVVATLATYQTILGREAGVTLLVLLLSLKQLEMHAKRDAFVVFFLSFFVLLTQFFYSQAITTAIMMMLAVLALLTTLISLNYTTHEAPLSKKVSLAFKLLLLGTPLMVALFVFFPRIQGPLWSLPSDAHRAKLGLSDSMKPGNFNELLQSDEVAFRVQFTGKPPPQNQLYWRGPVLSSYDGETWGLLDTRSSEVSRKPQPVKKRGASLPYTVTLEPHNKRWLLVLDAPTSLPDLPDRRLGMLEDLQVISDDPIDERLRYTLSSSPQYQYGPLEANLSLQDWLTLPPSYNPQTLALALRWRNATGHREGAESQLVQQALQWFHEEFRYTLEPVPLARDAIDDFLFTQKAGLCEHFASAFVVLMRAMDIPARVVTGYQGGELNPFERYLIVRQSDAHAWAEVWLAGQGWVRVDPTAAVAPERIDQGALSTQRQRAANGQTLSMIDNPFVRNLKLNWDAVTHAWNQWVLSYSAEKQRGLLDKLGIEQSSWRELLGILAGIVAIILLLLLLVLKHQQAKMDPVLLLWRQFCQQMRRLDLGPYPHEGANSYAQRLAPQLDEQRRAQLNQIVELYQTLRYGVTAKAALTTRNPRSQAIEATTNTLAADRAALLKAFKLAIARY